MKISDITQTCDACPAQWEGRLDDDRPLYIRVRWERLAVHIGPPGGTISDAIDAKPWFETSLINEPDGPTTLDWVCKIAGLSLATA